MSRRQGGEVGAVVELVIDAWGPRGEGVGLAPGGLPVAVPGALPGERVRVEIQGRGARRGWGRLVEIREPGPDRVHPPCPLAGPCGGCPWMHLSEEAQRREKAALLSRAFAESGAALPGPIPPVAPSPLGLGYRRRASFVFAGERAGLVLGAYRAGTHDVLDVEDCPVTDPALLDARDRVGHILELTALPPWDEATGAGVLRHLVLQGDPSTGAVLALLVVGREHARLRVDGEERDVPIPWERFGEAMLEPHKAPGGVVGVALSVNPAPGNAILGGPPRHLAGLPALETSLGATRLRLPPGAFSQVNHEAAAALYARVAERAGEGEQLVDLYCGVGAIALTLAPRFRRVWGVESHSGATAAARENARQAGHGHLTFISGDVAERLGAIPGAGAEVVVANPPRKGLGDAVVRALLARRPQRLIYVSCGPAALAREVAALTAGGYTFSHLDAFDLFPHTPHVEAVVTLDRSSR